MQEVEPKIDVSNARSFRGRIRFGKKLDEVIQAVRGGGIFEARDVFANKLRQIADLL